MFHYSPLTADDLLLPERERHRRDLTSVHARGVMGDRTGIIGAELGGEGGASKREPAQQAKLAGNTTAAVRVAT